MFRTTVALSLLSFAVANNFSALFESSLSSGAEIFLPTDGDWTQDIQQRWSSYRSPQYMGAIKPATEADVQQIVKIAYANHIPFLATGGGHGVSTTYAELKDGVNIDLGNFNSVDVHTENNTVTMGGSVIFSDTYDPLFSRGKWIPTGSGACVGFVGATLGAGLGPLQGLHGLAIDALLSVRMITGKGDLITASKTENSNIFWGIRGGGSNFGIITSATYQIFDAVNNGQIVNADFLLPAKANRTVWELISRFDKETLPAELALTASIRYNDTANETQIVFNALYFGPMEKAIPYLATLIDAPPIRQNISMVPWNRIFGSIGFGNGATQCTVTDRYISLYTVGLRRNDVDTYQSVFSQMANFFHETPAYRGFLTVNRFPQQAVLAVPDAETAYPWRETTSNIFWVNSYANASYDGAVDEFCKSARAKFQRTSGYPFLAAYENYAHGNEGVESWYSPRKLPRLTSLKRKYDPHQLFRYHNPLPLRWRTKEY